MSQKIFAAKIFVISSNKFKFQIFKQTFLIFFRIVTIYHGLRILKTKSLVCCYLILNRVKLLETIYLIFRRRLTINYKKKKNNFLFIFYYLFILLFVYLVYMVKSKICIYINDYWCFLSFTIVFARQVTTQTFALPISTCLFKLIFYEFHDRYYGSYLIV